MKKHIFTDIDGVFHPVDAVRQEIVGDEWRVAGEGLFRWAPLLWELIAPHDIDVVIHSTWRHSFRLDELREWFPEPMRPRIADVTGFSARHESIVRHVEEQRIERYIVIDDAPAEFPPAWAPLVVCDGTTGITDPAVQARIGEFLAS